MGEIINLGRARKEKARAEKKDAAKIARGVHGRTKAEKKLTDAKTKKTLSDLDAHKRDPK